MFEVHVTIHCPDLLAAAQLIAKGHGAPATTVAPVAPAPVPVEAKQQIQPAAVNPTTSGSPSTPTPTGSRSESPAPVPLAQAPTFTQAEIAKAGADLIASNPALMPKVNELLTQYGIQTLDKLNPDQYGAFATALRGLGAKI